jgi:hypothetical protein
VVAVAQTPPRAIRLSEQVRRLAIEGRRHPLTRSQLVSNLIEVLPPKLARVLLDDWHLDAPDDADVLRLYAHVEERAGNPGGVLVWSEQLLSRKPDDQKAIKLRDKAKEDLRKKLQPAGRGEPR